MAKIKIWNILWTESLYTVSGESCFGNILLYKNTGEGYIFGATATQKITFKSISSIKQNLNDSHCSRMKYLVGAYLKEYNE